MHAEYNSSSADFTETIRRALTQAATKLSQAVNTHTAEELASKCCCSAVVMSLWWSSKHLSFVRATTHKGQGNFSE